MWGRCAGLGLAAVFAAGDPGTPPGHAGCAGPAMPASLAVAAPRALASGEAFALVVETGSLDIGDVLTLRDAENEILGSVAGTLTGTGPQKQIVAILRELSEDPFHVTAILDPGDWACVRAPRADELLSLELVPIAIQP